MTHTGQFLHYTASHLHITKQGIVRYLENRETVIFTSGDSQKKEQATLRASLAKMDTDQNS
jgi:hypothetical protein